MLFAFTACYHSEEFNFLTGEQTIAVEFFYDQIDYENQTMHTLFEQLLAGKQDAMENAFVKGVNSEINDVMLIAKRHKIEDALASDVHYVFQVHISEVTSRGVAAAKVHVFDRTGKERYGFAIRTHCELDYSLAERVFESMGTLGDSMGRHIRYGI